MIASGEKKEEYREIKKYYQTRFQNNIFDTITFSNGYSKDRLQMVVELKSVKIGGGLKEWGAPEIVCYKLILGEIITKNFE